MRTVPVPAWVKAALDRWLTAADITAGPVSRAINKARIGRSGFSPKVVWGPHDLRRTCARLCHEAGGSSIKSSFY